MVQIQWILDPVCLAGTPSAKHCGQLVLKCVCFFFLMCFIIQLSWICSSYAAFPCGVQALAGS